MAMSINEVLEQLDSIWENSDDMCRDEYADEVWEKDKEAIDISEDIIKKYDKTVTKVKKMYYANKADMVDLEREFRESGILDNGCQDINETFERGYNNALEQVLDLLGVKDY